MRPGVHDQARSDIARELDRRKREQRKRVAIESLRLAERLASDPRRLLDRLNEIRIDQRFDAGG